MTFTISCSGRTSSLSQERINWFGMAARTYFVCCFLASAAAILLSYHPPLFMDYPDWVYQGVLFGKFLSGHPVAGYVLKHYPVPNSISTVGLGLFTLAFGWVVAAKAWMVLYLVVACGTCIYTGKVLEVSEDAVWWLLPGIIFFSRTYELGTINFDLGVCVFLLLVCALRRTEPRAWIVLGLVFLCFFAHFVTYAAAMLLVLFYCIGQHRWRLLWVSAATLPLLLWYAIARSLAHTNESALGVSPSSHLIPMFVVIAATVLFGFLRPRQPLLRILAPGLMGVAVLLVASAGVSIFWSGGRGAPEPPGNIVVLQDKLLAPLEFGFVNRSDFSGEALATTKPSQTWFKLILLCAVWTGISILYVGVKRLYWVSRREDAKERDLGFLWNFGSLMTLLYLLCPPNALGVVGIDLRLAELALCVMLFLLARCKSPTLRWAIVPAVLFTATNLYQFTVWQRGTPLPASLSELPKPFARCCRIDPLVRLKVYDDLRAKRMNDPIFPTGIFIDLAHEPVGQKSK